MSRSYHGARVLPLVLLTLINVAYGAVYEWAGGSGDWSNPLKWIPSTGVPGDSDTAIIAGGTVIVSADTSVLTVQIGGALTGSGTLTVTGSLEWAGGDWYGPGTTVLGPSATGILSGTGDRRLREGRTLVVEGDFEHQGTGRLLLSDASLVEIRTDGVLDLQSDAAWEHSSGAISSLVNAGTFRKSAGSGTSSLTTLIVTNSGLFEVSSGSVSSSSVFNNSGAVGVTSGELSLHGGGTSTGSWEVAEGSAIVFKSGSPVLGEGGGSSGAGVLRVEGARLAVEGDVSVSNLECLSGAVTGVGTLTVTGSLEWASGDWYGPGTTVLGPSASGVLSGTGDRRLREGRTLVVEGVLEHQDTGRLLFSDASLVEIREDGVLDLQSDAAWEYYSGAVSSIENAGTFRKSGGSGTSSLTTLIVTNSGVFEVSSGSVSSSSVFNNSGAVRVTSGELSLHGGGTSTGNWEIAEGSAIVFKSGSPVLGEGGTSSGAGVLRVEGARLAVEGDVPVSNLECLSGAVTGVGTLTVTESLEWASGDWYGPGTTVLGPSATGVLSGTGDRRLREGRTLVVEGVLEHQDTGRLLFSDASLVEIREDGVLDLQSDAAWEHYSGAISSLVNAGTFRKSGGSGTSSLTTLIVTNSGLFEVSSGSVSSSSVFNNSGAVRVTSGELSLHGGGTSTGNWEIAEGSAIVFKSGSPVLGEGGTSSGAGVLRVEGARLAVEGDVPVSNLECLSGAVTGVGTLTVTESLEWASGDWHGPGTTVLGPSATGVLSGTGDRRLREGRTLAVEGVLEHQDTGRLLFSDASLVEIREDGVLDLQSDAAWEYYSGAVSSIVNGGTFIKSSGAGTSHLGNITFQNNGTLAIAQGTLNFQRSPDLTETGTVEFVVSGPSHPDRYGRLTSSQLLELDGELAVTFEGGWAPSLGDRFLFIPTSTTGQFIRFRSSPFPGGVFPNIFYGESGMVEIGIVSPFVTRILRISRDPDGTMRVLVEGVVNLSYTMESSPNLQVWDPIPVETVTMPATGEWEFSDPDGGTVPQRFYRIVWNP